MMNMNEGSTKIEIKKSYTFKKQFQKHPELGAFAILIVAFVFFSFLSPVNDAGISAFMSLKNIGNVIEQTAAISIIAFGMTMVLLIGGIDLSVGSIVGLVIMVGCKLMMTSGWGILPTVLIMLVIGIASGALNGFLIVKFNIQPFLITMSTMTILRGVVYAVSKGESIYLTDTTFCDIFCRGNLLGIPVTAFWTALFLVAMYFVASKSKYGRNAQAIGGNEVAARNSGVNVPLVKVGTYVLAGALAAFAGIITMARLGSANATTGTGTELNAIAAAIIGGTSFTGDGGNMFGTLLGSLVMGVLVNGLTILSVDVYFQDIIKGSIIILAVIGSNYLVSNRK